MPFKYELQNLLSGTGAIAEKNVIQTISHHLRKSKATSAGTQKEEHIKEQEAALIIAFAKGYFLFYNGIDDTRYIAEGAEQKVYLAAENVHIIKVNDAIFYLTWQDYFNSLLLHNYFFTATVYELIGFLHKKK